MQVFFCMFQFQAIAAQKQQHLPGLTVRTSPQKGQQKTPVTSGNVVGTVVNAPPTVTVITSPTSQGITSTVTTPNRNVQQQIQVCTNIPGNVIAIPVCPISLKTMVTPCTVCVLVSQSRHVTVCLVMCPTILMAIHVLNSL